MYSTRIQKRIHRWRLPASLAESHRKWPLELFHTRRACTAKMVPEAATESDWRCCDSWHRKLHNKWNSRVFARQHGCPVPLIYWRGLHARDIPFEDLPQSYVVKPIYYSAACRDVYLVRNGFDEMRQRLVTPDEIIENLESRLGWRTTRRRRKPLMVQEYIEAEPGLEGFSRELRVHAFAGKVAMISHIVRTDNSNCIATFFTPEWEVFEEPMIDSPLLPREALQHHMPPPPCLEELFASASRMSATLGTYIRLDFLVNERGYWFGEPTFTSGFRVTPYADQYLESFWRKYCPDAF